MLSGKRDGKRPAEPVDALAARAVPRDHGIEADRVSRDEVMERPVPDPERVIVDDDVRAVIDLLAILVVGAEGAVGPERVGVRGRRPNCVRAFGRTMDVAEVSRP